MTVDDFAETTRHVIQTIGLLEFECTASFPNPGCMHALAEVPKGEGYWEAVIARASENAQPGEEFFVSFKVGHDQFKVIRRADGASEERTYDVA